MSNSSSGVASTAARSCCQKGAANAARQCAFLPPPAAAAAAAAGSACSSVAPADRGKNDEILGGMRITGSCSRFGQRLDYYCAAATRNSGARSSGPTRQKSSTIPTLRSVRRVVARDAWRCWLSRALQFSCWCPRAAAPVAANCQHTHKRRRAQRRSPWTWSVYRQSAPAPVKHRHRARPAQPVVRCARRSTQCRWCSGRWESCATPCWGTPCTRRMTRQFHLGAAVTNRARRLAALFACAYVRLPQSWRRLRAESPAGGLIQR